MNESTKTENENDAASTETESKTGILGRILAGILAIPAMVLVWTKRLGTVTLKVAVLGGLAFVAMAGYDLATSDPSGLDRLVMERAALERHVGNAMERITTVQTAVVLKARGEARVIGSEGVAELQKRAQWLADAAARNGGKLLQSVGRPFKGVDAPEGSALSWAAKLSSTQSEVDSADVKALAEVAKAMGAPIRTPIKPGSSWFGAWGERYGVTLGGEKLF